MIYYKNGVYHVRMKSNKFSTEHLFCFALCVTIYTPRQNVVRLDIDSKGEGRWRVKKN